MAYRFPTCALVPFKKLLALAHRNTDGLMRQISEGSVNKICEDMKKVGMIKDKFGKPTINLSCEQNDENYRLYFAPLQADTVRIFNMESGILNHEGFPVLQVAPHLLRYIDFTDGRHRILASDKALRNSTYDTYVLCAITTMRSTQEMKIDSYQKSEERPVVYASIHDALQCLTQSFGMGFNIDVLRDEVKNVLKFTKPYHVDIVCKLQVHLFPSSTKLMDSLRDTELFTPEAIFRSGGKSLVLLVQESGRLQLAAFRYMLGGVFGGLEVRERFQKACILLGAHISKHLTTVKERLKALASIAHHALEITKAAKEAKTRLDMGSIPIVYAEALRFAAKDFSDISNGKFIEALKVVFGDHEEAISRFLADGAISDFVQRGNNSNNSILPSVDEDTETYDKGRAKKRDVVKSGSHEGVNHLKEDAPGTAVTEGSSFREGTEEKETSKARYSEDYQKQESDANNQNMQSNSVEVVERDLDSVSAFLAVSSVRRGEDRHEEINARPSNENERRNPDEGSKNTSARNTSETDSIVCVPVADRSEHSVPSLGSTKDGQIQVTKKPAAPQIRNKRTSSVSLPPTRRSRRIEVQSQARPALSEIGAVPPLDISNSIKKAAKRKRSDAKRRLETSRKKRKQNLSKSGEEQVISKGSVTERARCGMASMILADELLSRVVFLRLNEDCEKSSNSVFCRLERLEKQGDDCVIFVDGAFLKTGLLAGALRNIQEIASKIRAAVFVTEDESDDIVSILPTMQTAMQGVLEYISGSQKLFVKVLLPQRSGWRGPVRTHDVYEDTVGLPVILEDIYDNVSKRVEELGKPTTTLFDLMLSHHHGGVLNAALKGGLKGYYFKCLSKDQEELGQNIEYLRLLREHVLQKCYCGGHALLDESNESSLNE